MLYVRFASIESSDLTVNKCFNNSKVDCDLGLEVVFVGNVSQFCYNGREHNLINLIDDWWEVRFTLYIINFSYV